MAPAAAGWLRHACGARKTFTTFTARKLAVNDPIEPSPLLLSSPLVWHFFSQSSRLQERNPSRCSCKRRFAISLLLLLTRFCLVTFFRAIYGDAITSSGMLQDPRLVGFAGFFKAFHHSQLFINFNPWRVVGPSFILCVKLSIFHVLIPKIAMFCLFLALFSGYFLQNFPLA